MKAPINNPTCTGTVGGLSKVMVQSANVDNTSDLAKPISTATQLAPDAKQIRLLFGEVPTTNVSRLFDYGDNKFRAIHVNSPLSTETIKNACSTIRADCYTKTEADTKTANLVDSAPATLNTLNELATALSNDNFRHRSQT